ncbi:hypothetical protein [Mycolicibacterium aichiense]|uniref:hypothetical protein n=2 Tax=Mycolicibacterium aichiense TaxID=1799 RepID=UPI0011C019E7|nr:hypothetical protein [Mycolicibacterium aichiense]MCV7017263.1 hypothetical protein [Mycolicibacterium aichiense]
MGMDADEEKGDDRHGGQQHTLVYVSGVAALVLLAILVYAVLDTSESSQRPDGPVTYAPAISTTTSSTKKTSTTSRTTSTRVSTTDLNPGSASSISTSPSDTSSEVVIPSETEYSTPTTTVTLTNPYATTSPPNAGRT